MAKQKSYSGMLGDLARLSDAMAANAAEIPHLEGIRARLEKAVQEAQEVAKEQAALETGKQEASKRLAEGTGWRPASAGSSPRIMASARRSWRSSESSRSAAERAGTRCRS
jgi:hypothetical protein